MRVFIIIAGGRWERLMRALLVDDIDNVEPDVAYAQSKLANVLFTKELAKRLAKEQIYAFTLHPGGSLTLPSPSSAGR